MAITKSDIVTDSLNLDTQADQGHYSRVRGVSAHQALSGAAADNDIIFFHKIPVNALIDSIILNSDDLGTTGDINIGFYPGNVDVDNATDSDAVDEDAIGTAIDVNAAALSNVEIRFETKDINTINSKAWELAGLSSEPDYADFYIAGTFSEATTAAGDICIRTLYRD